MGKDGHGGGEGLSEEVPLLKNTYYHANCPGCRLDRRNETRTGVPYTEFACMWLVTVCSNLPIQSLFPFLYFMIRDLHIAKQVEDIGFYAGFIGASYMIGRALTSTLWGVVADKHGRKPVLVITLIAVIILNALFGLSSIYWMALTTRCLLGLFSGMLGPIKISQFWMKDIIFSLMLQKYAGKNMVTYLSLISSSRAIGLIVGPAIGGYLAQPADKYPGIFSQQSIFGRFPYFLPNLCISLLAVVALISCIWLPETLHKHSPPADSNNSIEAVEESVSEPTAKESGAGYWSLFTNWPLMSSILVYCIFSLQDVAYVEVFSLWAVSDKKYGGLSFTSTDVGNVLAISDI